VTQVSVERIPGLVRKLYKVVLELERLFPGRRFTLDGHLVGSIGEVIAVSRYDIELLPASHPCHDARDSLGRLVQIKATQRRAVALRSEPDYLIVLQLDPSGNAREVYNGRGAPAWGAAGRMQRNGQRPVSLSTLSTLAGRVGAEDRIRKRTPRLVRATDRAGPQH